MSDRKCVTGLLIGGPGAGRRLSIPSHRGEFVFAHTNDCGQMERHTYRRALICGETTAFELWLHRDMPVDSAIEKLIHDYIERHGGRR